MKKKNLALVLLVVRKQMEGLFISGIKQLSLTTTLPVSRKAHQDQVIGPERRRRGREREWEEGEREREREREEGIERERKLREG